MESSNTFRWLHISDFHAGMEGASRKWGQIRNKFHNDISSFIKNNGQLDLVIFSGDFTQAGKDEEFNYVYDEIQAIWAKFKECGCDPYLICVPGNHDLTRPKPGTPVPLAVLNWNVEGVEGQVFDMGGSYASELQSIFKGYLAFVERLAASGIRMPLDRKGSLPGEGSGVIAVRGRRIGAVGLNTAWSQWAGGDLKRHLHVSERQISSVLDTSLDDWSKENDINLLITHHPEDWFTDDSRKVFVNDINPLGAFSGHLFGHMHESVAKFENHGHDKNKASLQAASLFGLEKYSERNLDRRHGYYYAQVDFEREMLKYWPRKAELISGAGGWRIVPESASLPEGSHETGEIPFQTVKKKNIKMIL